MRVTAVTLHIQSRCRKTEKFSKGATMVRDKRSDTIVRRTVSFNAEPPSSVMAGGRGEITGGCGRGRARAIERHRPHMGRHWRHTTEIPCASWESARTRNNAWGNIALAVT